MSNWKKIMFCFLSLVLLLTLGDEFVSASSIDFGGETTYNGVRNIIRACSGLY